MLKNLFGSKQVGSSSTAKKDSKIQQLIKKAELGDADAQVNLGQQYETGNNILSQDYAEAMKWYLKAANQGNKFAQSSLGDMYYYGRGISKDPQQAVDWYRRAAEQNYAKTQHDLGYMYYHGEGIPQDYQQATYWYRKAAEQNHAKAQYDLANMYYYGEGVAQDYQQTVYWYRKAAEQKHVNAQFDLGQLYYFGQRVNQDYRQAAYWFQKAAEQNHAEAQNNLAVMYQQGEGVPQNYQQCFYWYSKAASQNHIDAQYNLGWLLKNGYGIQQNYQQAFLWYSKAAMQNHVLGQLELGVCYLQGLGVTTNYAEALKWTRLAADQGNEAALNNLGHMYEYGLGVLSNLSQAIYYYLLAATHVSSSPVATENLNRLSKEGYAYLITHQQQMIQDKKLEEQKLQEYSSVLSKLKSSSTETQQSEIEKIKKEIELSKSLATLEISFHIAREELTFDQELGRGGFGIVFRGKWRYNDVAIKQLQSSQLSNDTLEEFQSEMKLMAQLRSPNIVQLYGITDKTPYCIVMEYLPKGDLFNLLHSNEELSWEQRARIALDIACGLAYLHKENIMHRDLKSKNILLDNALKAKLADFGLAKIKTASSIKSTGKIMGTLAWMAPELFKRKAEYTLKADVYSYGIVVWELSSRKIPFEDARGNETLIMQWVSSGERDEIPKETPAKLAKVIQDSWAQEPEKRPNADEVIQQLQTEDGVPFPAKKSTGYHSNFDSTSMDSGYRDNLDSINSSSFRP